MHKDEYKLIKTLAHESEKISTKDNFFSLSTIKEADDMNVSAWNDSKTLSGFKALPPIVSHALRNTQIDTFSKPPLNQSPNSAKRIKLSQARSKSISVNRASVYKTKTLVITEVFNQIHLNQPRERKLKLPKIKKNAILSMYLPYKARRRFDVGKVNLASVDQLLPLLQPMMNNTVTKKVMSSLRSKADLNKTPSKQLINRGAHSLSV